MALVDPKEDTISRLELENAKVTNELLGVRRENDRLNQRNFELYQQIEDLEKEVEQRSNSAEVWRRYTLSEKSTTEKQSQEITELKNALTSRDSSNRELAKQKMNLMNELELAHGHLRELSDDLLAMSQKNAGLEEKIKTLEEQNAVLTEDMDALEHQLAESYSTSPQDGEKSRRRGCRNYESDGDDHPSQVLSEELFDSDHSTSDSSTQYMDQDSLSSLDSNSHADIRTRIDKLRSSISWDNLTWLAPDDIIRLKELSYKVLSNSDITQLNGNSNDSNDNNISRSLTSLEVLIVALAKQKIMIESLIDNSANGFSQGPLNTPKNATTEHNNSNKQSTEDVKETEEVKREQQETEYSGFAQQSQSILPNLPGRVRRPLIGLLFHTFKAVYGDAKNKSPKVFIAINIVLLFYGVLSFLIGYSSGYFATLLLCQPSATSFSSGSTSSAYYPYASSSHQLGLDQLIYKHCDSNSQVPWWVGHNFPLVEKLMFALENWMVENYGNVIIN
ncbi:hypothetical protein V1511DRAFT_504267 [Dipodascopsis uninucleata]